MNKIKAVILVSLALASSTVMPMIKNDWFKKIQALVPFAALGVAGYAVWQASEARKEAVELKDQNIILNKTVAYLETLNNDLAKELDYLRTDHSTLATLFLQDMYNIRSQFPVNKTVDVTLHTQLNNIMAKTTKDILIGRIAETLLASDHATIDKQTARSRDIHMQLMRITSKDQLQKPGLPKNTQL